MQKMSWPAKPAKFQHKIVRNQFKNFYHQQRYEDRSIGKQIDSLFTQFHAEFRLEPTKRSAEKLNFIVAELTKLRKEKTFRQEFPTFASFMKYVRAENLTIKQLMASS